MLYDGSEEIDTWDDGTWRIVILERDVNGMLIKRGYALRRYGWWKGRDSGMDEGYGMVIGAWMTME